MRRRCKLPGCRRWTVQPHGYCVAHGQMRRLGRPLRPLGTGRPWLTDRHVTATECSVEGCTSPCAARGKCKRHYMADYHAERRGGERSREAVPA